MKVYIAHSSSYDFAGQLYEPIKQSDLAGRHEFFLPHDDNRRDGAGELSKDIIRNSDILIAEVSYPTTGEGIEIGWADAFGVPIACVYQEGAKPSGSLRFVSEKFATYTDAQSLIEALRNLLGE
jgi:hypothetical protein